MINDHATAGYTVQWTQILFNTTYTCESIIQDILVSSSNKTNRQDVTEILMKVALNTIIPPFHFHLFDKHIFISMFRC
jgi:hypothetical protein